jgi:DNA topoisomerase VI subunit B
MKLDQFSREVMASPGTSSAFSANMNGVAFSILSKSMYQHPIAAIVREIICNAIDSHKSANKSDIPVHVCLPNKFSPNFSVEDFGVGLDDQGVREIFSTYFGSTKSESNTDIGGFGLGSKTPFSYSETFMIRTRKDNKEREYVAFIDEDGMVVAFKRVNNNYKDIFSGKFDNSPVKWFLLNATK